MSMQTVCNQADAASLAGAIVRNRDLGRPRDCGLLKHQAEVEGVRQGGTTTFQTLSKPKLTIFKA
jgi:hypothetical protein